MWIPAIVLGAIPLADLAILHWQGHRREAAYWWLAVAFAVSVVADLATLITPHRLVAQVYPLLQAGIVTAVLVPRPWAIGAIAAYVVAAGASVTARDGAGHDVLLRVVAFGLVAALTWWRVPRTNPALRFSLLVSFAGGALTWCGYVLWPGWTSWGAMQIVRAVGIGYFLLAAWRAVDEPREERT